MDSQQKERKAARQDCPRILAILASNLGDLDIADDAVQDALLDAIRSWPERGVPNNPGMSDVVRSEVVRVVIDHAAAGKTSSAGSRADIARRLGPVSDATGVDSVGGPNVEATRRRP